MERGSIGLLLDLDGTISEMVPQPGAAVVSAPIKTALGQLRLRLALVAIVTGRPALEARDIVGDDELAYVGNHGLEFLVKGRTTLVEEARPYAPFLADLRVRLRARLPIPGLIFEDKGASFAVHYRHSPDPNKAHSEVYQAIQEEAGGRVKLLMGKTVINVLPPVDLTKGTAVTFLIKEYGLAGAILLGDDVTDLDAFRAASGLFGRQCFASISVAVIGLDSPRELEDEVDYTLSSVAEVEAFLIWLAKQTGQTSS